MIKKEYPLSDLTGKIIGCAIEVHMVPGNGFQEVIYQRSLALEMGNRGLSLAVFGFKNKHTTMNHNKIEYITGDKSLREKLSKTAGLLQKFNSGVILMISILFYTSCDRPKCKNSNPVFDMYDPESVEYRKEVGSEIERIGQDKLEYWIYTFKNINSEHYIKLYVQSDGLCAILFARNISGRAFIKPIKENYEHGFGSSGAKLFDVQLTVDTVDNETNFIIEKIGRIID